VHTLGLVPRRAHVGRSDEDVERAAGDGGVCDYVEDSTRALIL